MSNLTKLPTMADGTCSMCGKLPAEGKGHFTDGKPRCIEEDLPVKTLDQHFTDWESHVFGLGYGTGEQYIIPALKHFMDAIGRLKDGLPNAYLHDNLESAVGNTTAWLLITILVKYDIIEYGTSPRCGWLTKEGEALRAYLDTKTCEHLLDLTGKSIDDHTFCQPDFCNCGPSGYSKIKICHNPFWKETQ